MTWLALSCSNACRMHSTRGRKANQGAVVVVQVARAWTSTVVVGTETVAFT